MLSYGYDEDMQALAKAVPRGVQTMLMSATLTEEVDTLKGLFCRNPVVLKLKEKEEKEGENISQFVVKYVVSLVFLVFPHPLFVVVNSISMLTIPAISIFRCAEDEKFLLIYVIFKLRLVKGKSIVFVGDLDRSYRLKLFLEQFGIKSCVLNSELPVNSRIHVVQEFNKGIYDIIIAADEQEVIGTSQSPKPKKQSDREQVQGQDDEENENEDEEEKSTKLEKPQSSKKRKRSGKQNDYGISRGIDFQDVACVLNFDFPTTSKSYMHRIGRTGRAGKAGMALSFVVPRDLYKKHRPTSHPTCKHDESVLARVVKRQANLGREVKPYNFDMAQVEAFRYRMSDALRTVTRVAVQEARVKEIRQELLKSEKLKKHFEENPDELKQLRHDGELHTARLQAHLKHVPDYLLPVRGKKVISAGSDNLAFIGMRKTNENRIRRAREKNRGRSKGKKTGGKKVDPLKTFKRS